MVPTGFWFCFAVSKGEGLQWAMADQKYLFLFIFILIFNFFLNF
jgi:hypothetical protein